MTRGLKAGRSFEWLGAAARRKAKKDGVKIHASFDNVPTHGLDLDRTIRFFLFSKPYLKKCFLDRKFFKALRARGRELVQQGILTEDQFYSILHPSRSKNPIFRPVDDRVHRDHFHIRVKGPGCAGDKGGDGIVRGVGPGG